MQFRKDINGLRAIAIIAVMLFHFNARWMPGGFAGVDVFFVISGFLMTGIIFRGLEQDNFSVVKFYVARANRIIPALAALCLVLLVFGWFFLPGFDYKILSKHVASSLVFVSNIVYWKESGYFDAASLEKWLLHTWSLSTEWQFYILYPLVLMVMRKFMTIKTMKMAVMVGTIFGFIFCAIATYKWRTPSYYLLPTRAWEMMIGGVAYLYPFKLKNNEGKILEGLGVILIAISYAFISEKNVWPGYLSFLPVFGAFLIIQAQRNDSIITGNAIFQNIGKWSYSIYLWHWPIVVGIYYFSLSTNYIFIGILASLLLGFISNKYIERFKFKNDLVHFSDYLKFKPAHMVLSLGVISTIFFVSDGMLIRYPSDLQKMNENALTSMNDWDYPLPNLQIGSTQVRLIKGTTDKNILFIGASHIEQTYPYVSSHNSKYNIYYVTSEGCLISPSYVHPKWSCANIQNYKNILNTVKFDKIVTSYYLFPGVLSKDQNEREQQLKTRISEYNEFLRFAKSKTDNFFMILGEPKGPEFDPKKSIRKSLEHFITLEQARSHYTIAYDTLNKLDTKGIVKIDPINYLCDKKVCDVMDKDFNYFYKDASHMRPWYAKKALGYLDQIID